jgi:hypothetical protein
MRASNVLQLAPAFRIAYVNAITVPFVTGIDDYMEIARALTRPAVDGVMFEPP